MKKLRADVRALLREVDDYLRRAKIKESTLSRELFDASGRLAQIRAGTRKPFVQTVLEKRQWLQDNPPELWRYRKPRGRPKGGRREAQ